jgi:lysophospholipid acyltransferase (LPLAT)-like uncharacterized protein
MLPYPFTKVVFLWGDPIAVGSDLSADDIEKKRVELETTLIRLTDKAEEMACGS